MALEVIFDGDIAPLNKKIKEAEANLQDFANEKAYRIKLGLDTTEVDKNIKSVKTELSSLKTTLKDTGNAFQKELAPKVASGSNALTQFGRIAQDAPYGIQGVANNITAFGESFGYLVTQTGSAGGALKALGSSLLGAGGLMLALSVVTSGLTYMAQQGLTVSDVVKKMTGTFDEARKSMQDLNAEVAKNAQGQISEMNAYVSAAKNINLSMSDRLIAVKKLQDEYPAYFGNLTKEQILNGNVAGAVREVTKALIEKAKATAYVDKIVKLAEEEEKIQSNINNEILRQVKLTGASNKEAYATAKIINDVLKGYVNLNDVLKNTGDRQQYLAAVQADAILRSNTALKSLGSEIRANIALQDNYTDRINKSTAASIKLEQQAEKAGKKAGVTPQVGGLNASIDTAGLVSLSGMLTQIAKKGSESIKGYEGAITTSFKGIKQNVSSELLATMKLLYDFNSELDRLVKTSVTKTFEDLGTAIGTALAQGGNVFGAIGKTLIASMGAFLSDMGSLLIKYGTLAVAKGVIDKALTSGNPVVTIGAGVAAIAVGVALKGAGAAISSKASGSQGNGGASYNTGASYSSPASSSTSTGGSFSSSGSGTVVFEIAGTTLLGVLSNTIDKNKRLGGALGL